MSACCCTFVVENKNRLTMLKYLKQGMALCMVTCVVNYFFNKCFKCLSVMQFKNLKTFGSEILNCFEFLISVKEANKIIKNKEN